MRHGPGYDLDLYPVPTDRLAPSNACPGASVSRTTLFYVRPYSTSEVHQRSRRTRRDGNGRRAFERDW